MSYDTIHYETNSKRYLCNQACNTTLSKITRDETKVTCKNCLRDLKHKFEWEPTPSAGDENK